MCGIAGVVAADGGRPIDRAVFLRMRDILWHRGPDDAGVYLAPGVGLASRRLAILDLSERGRMPMSTPDGRYWIVHNGEIYNYRELRVWLEARGHVFRSDTDTEVLLALYVEEGPAALERLVGMFAFAIWDEAERTLLAARDRLGIKPLYYAWHDGAFYFASEQKALWAAGVPLRFDHACWPELLCFRYIAGEGTSHEGVRRLLPGHYLLLKDGRLRVVRWWCLADRLAEMREVLPADVGEHFRTTLDGVVELHRVSDVPLGVLLSGGLDSGTVAASLAAQAGAGVASFTVRFAEEAYDEGRLAAQVADRWGLVRHELFVSPEELPALLKRAAWLHDEPLAHGSDLHLHALARLAKPVVTVLLSGEGADETMGGYVRYAPLLHPRLLDLARPWLPPLLRASGQDGRIRKFAEFLSLGDTDRLILLNACDVFPGDLTGLGLREPLEWPFRRTVLAEAKRVYHEPVRQAMYLDLHTFLLSVLERNDSMTMGASIECRVPFLDHRLVELTAALPTRLLFDLRGGKLPIRRWLGDRLPAAVLKGRKWGFGVPWHEYLRRVSVFEDRLRTLPDSQLLRDSPMDREVVRRLARRFLAGNAAVLPLLLRIFLVEAGWEAVRAQTPLAMEATG